MTDRNKMSLLHMAMHFADKHLLILSTAFLSIIAAATINHLQALRSASHEVEKGASLLSAGDDRGAIAVFDKALKISPSADAYLYRGRAFASLNEFDAAAYNYNCALKLEPENLDALNRAARLNLERSRFKTAITYFLRYLQLVRPGGVINPDVLNGLGLAYMGSAQYTRALTQFSKNIDANANDQESLLNRARCYFRMNRTQLGIKDCSTVLEQNPTAFDALILRGQGYSVLHDKLNALRDFDLAVTVEPTNISSLVARGNCYLEGKDFVKATQDFDDAIKTQPNDSRAYLGKAAIEWIRGNFKNAESAFATLSQRPGFKPDANFFEGRGQFFLRAGKFQKALSDFKNAQVLDPNHSSYNYLNIADCYGGLKQYRAALLACDRVLSTEPENADANLKHGEYSYLAGNKVTAKSDLTKAIQLDPLNVNAYFRRGEDYVGEKQYKAAGEDFEQVLKLEPTSKLAVDRLSYCRDKLGSVQASPPK